MSRSTLTSPEPSEEGAAEPSTPSPVAPGPSDDHPPVEDGPAPASAPQRPWYRNLWGDLRSALHGGEEDFTQGSLRRAIALLAVPMMLEMGMESVFAVVDAFFVARLGADAVATIGLTEAVLTLLFAVALGVSMAATAVVARRIGEKDPEAAAVTAVQTLVLGLAVSLVFGVVGIFGAEPLLRLMGADDEVVAVGAGYTRVLFGGSFTVVLLFLGNGIFRGAGDAVIAMRVLWFANLINIALDPCFIFGLGPFPELGVTGAAVATTIGRGCGVAYLLWNLVHGGGRVVIRRRHLRLDLPVLGRLARVSVGGVGQFLVETASWVALVRVLAVFGSAVLAGYTIAIRILIFTFLPSWGLSNAAATLVGQNLGARQVDRAERSVWLTARYNLYFMGTVAILLLLFPRPLVALFTDDPAVVEMAVDTLFWFASCYVFLAYGLVMVQAFNGAGDTTTPTLLKLCTHWLWQIPVAWFLAIHLELGPVGVLIAVASAEAAIGVLGALAFRTGKWKTREV